MWNNETTLNRLKPQECRLHSIVHCRLCEYDGSYSLDVENPSHQLVISNYLERTRTRNYREVMFDRINNQRDLTRKARKLAKSTERTIDADDIVELSSDDDSCSLDTTTTSQTLSANSNPPDRREVSNEQNTFPSVETVSLNDIPGSRFAGPGVHLALRVEQPESTNCIAPQATMPYTSHSNPAPKSAINPGQWLEQLNPSTSRFRSCEMNSMSSGPLQDGSNWNVQPNRAALMSSQTTTVPDRRFPPVQGQWMIPENAMRYAHGMNTQNHSEKRLCDRYGMTGYPNVFDTTGRVSMEEQSLVRPNYFQPWRQHALGSIPTEISLSLSHPIQTGTSPFPRQEPSRSLMVSNFQSSVPLQFLNTSMARYQNPVNSTGGPENQSVQGRPVRHQPKAVEIPATNHASQRNMMNPIRTDCHSPDEVVESYLHRRLSRSTAPPRNVIMPSHGFVVRSNPSLGADPSQSAAYSSLVLKRTHLENTHNNYSMLEGPPLKRLQYLAPNSNFQNVFPRHFPRGMPNKNDLRFAPPGMGKTISAQSHLLPLPVDPALNRMHFPGNLPINATLASSSNLMPQGPRAQPIRPLPPFESFSGKYHSWIKEYWTKPTLSAGDSLESVNNGQNWRLERSEPQLPMLPTSRETSAKTNISSFRNDDLLKENVQSYQDTTPRFCKFPIFKPKKPRPTIPRTNRGRVAKKQIPSKSRSVDVIVLCEGRGFKVECATVENASPIMKEFIQKCCQWMSVDGVEYRVFEVLGVPYWAMRELLQFICRQSYNHNVMKSSYMKGVLEKLKIKYRRNRNFVFPDLPHPKEL